MKINVGNILKCLVVIAFIYSSSYTLSFIMFSLFYTLQASSRSSLTLGRFPFNHHKSKITNSAIALAQYHKNQTHEVTAAEIQKQATTILTQMNDHNTEPSKFQIITVILHYNFIRIFWGIEAPSLNAELSKNNDIASLIIQTPYQTLHFKSQKSAQEIFERTKGLFSKKQQSSKNSYNNTSFFRTSSKTDNNTLLSLSLGFEKILFFRWRVYKSELYGYSLKSDFELGNHFRASYNIDTLTMCSFSLLFMFFYIFQTPLLFVATYTSALFYIMMQTRENYSYICCGHNPLWRSYSMRLHEGFIQYSVGFNLLNMCYNAVFLGLIAYTFNPSHAFLNQSSMLLYIVCTALFTDIILFVTNTCLISKLSDPYVLYNITDSSELKSYKFKQKNLIPERNMSGLKVPTLLSYILIKFHYYLYQLTNTNFEVFENGPNFVETRVIVALKTALLAPEYAAKALNTGARYIFSDQPNTNVHDREHCHSAQLIL